MPSDPYMKTCHFLLIQARNYLQGKTHAMDSMCEAELQRPCKLKNHICYLSGGGGQREFVRRAQVTMCLFLDMQAAIYMICVNGVVSSFCLCVLTIDLNSFLRFFTKKI